MKEDIKQMMIKNAGLTLKDWALVNPDKMAERITSHIKAFIEWSNVNADEFEYYTTDQKYNYWKNNIL